MNINSCLSAKGCWRLVNACQNGRTAEEIRERCRIAEEWLKGNNVITNDEFDELMMAVSFIHRESYHQGRFC